MSTDVSDLKLRFSTEGDAQAKGALLGMDAGLKGIQTQAARTGAALGAMTKVFIAGAAVAIATAGAVGVALFKIGDAYDAMSDTIAVKTGATGKQLQSLQTEAIDIFKAIPASMDTIGNAISLITTKTGDTGKVLEDVTASEIELARITGTDLNGNIEASTHIFNAWNVAGKDQTATLDGLFNASQKYGVSVDVLMQQTDQFSTTMKQMGLNADESANFIGGLDRAGVHLGPAIRGINKDIADAAKHGIDAKTALTGTFDAIKNAKDPTEATAIAVKAFGVKAGPELAQAILSGKLGVDDLTASVDDSGKSILATAKSTYDFSENFKIFKNNLEAALIPVGSFVFQMLNNVIPLLTSATRWFGNVVGQLKPFALAMRAAFESGVPIKQLVEFLPPGLQNLEQGFLKIADAAGDLVAAFKSGGFSGLVKALPGEIGQALSGLGDLIGGAFSDLGSVISDAIRTINWNTVGNAFLDGLKIAWQFAVAHPGLIIGFVFGGMLGAAVGAAIDAYGWEKLGGNILTGLQKAFAAIPWSQLGSGAKGIGDGILQSVKDIDWNQTGFVIGKGLHDAIASIGPSLLSALQDNWKTIALYMATWPILLVAAMGSFTIAAAPKALEFIQGFLSGLTNGWTDKIGPWLMGLGVRALVDIGDLTATLIDVGTGLLKGFETGMDREWDSITKWLGDVKDQVMPWIGDLSQTFLGVGQSLLQGLFDGAVQIWDTFTQWLGDRGAVAVSAVGDLGNYLVDAGEALLDGLYAAAQDMWDTAAGWLSGIGGMAIDAIGNLGGYLYQAGADLVEGLIAGAQDRLGALSTIVGQILSIVARIPGMGNSPWPTMIEAGHDAIDGLVMGIGHRQRALNAAINNTISAFGVTPSLSGHPVTRSENVFGGTYPLRQASSLPSRPPVIIQIDARGAVIDADFERRIERIAARVTSGQRRQESR